MQFPTQVPSSTDRGQERADGGTGPVRAETGGKLSSIRGPSFGVHERRKRGGGGGTGGRVPRSRKINGGRPPRNYAISAYFFFIGIFSNMFEIKWPKSEEKLNFGGRWVWVPMNPSPQNKACWRRPCPSPCSLPIKPPSNQKQKYGRWRKC